MTMVAFHQLNIEHDEKWKLLYRGKLIWVFHFPSSFFPFQNLTFSSILTATHQHQHQTQHHHHHHHSSVITTDIILLIILYRSLRHSEDNIHGTMTRIKITRVGMDGRTKWYATAPTRVTWNCFVNYEWTWEPFYNKITDYIKQMLPLLLFVITFYYICYYIELNLSSWDFGCIINR